MSAFPWTGPGVDLLARSLASFLWQGTVVALLLAGALAALRRAAPQVRYAVACGALALLALAPVATAVAGAAALEGPGPAALPRPGAVATEAPSALAVEAVPPPSTVEVGSGRLRDWAVGLWLFGVLLLACNNLLAWFGVRRLATTNVRPATSAWRSRFEALAAALGVRRGLSFLASARVRVPMVVGWLRPVVLVPSGAFTAMPPAELEAILLHELAHIRRHDYLVNLLQTLVETLLFYHPAVWWVSRQVRREREDCCDELAVGAGGAARTTLARALVRVAELRAGALGPAVAADGGSLERRLRRLVRTGRPDRELLPQGRLAAALAALVALVAGVLLAASTPAVVADPEPPQPLSQAGEVHQGAAPRLREGEGVWTGRRSGGGLRLDLQLASGGEGWHAGIQEPLSAFDGVVEGAGAHFGLSRDAGSFRFEGDFDAAGAGSGRFSFRPNAAFAAELRSMGYTVEESRLLELALHDVSLDFVQQMRQLGYGDETLDRLVELRIHGVGPAGVRELAELGYADLAADRLVEAAIHGVTPTWIRELRRAGLEHPTMGELVEMRIHGVEAGLIDRLRSMGYDGLDPQRLVELRIHGVTPEFVASMSSAGFPRLPLAKLVELRIHGVDAQLVEALRAAGCTGLDADGLLELRIQGVTPDQVEALARLGYAGLPAHQLAEMAIHGVTPRFIQEIASAGYRDLPLDDLVDFAIQGVDPAFIRSLAGEGVTGVEAAELVELRIHGIDADFVRRARERGFTDLTPERLIELKIQGLERWTAAPPAR